MEIDKDTLLKCLDILPGGFKDHIAHAMVLLAYIVDMTERKHPDKPIRVSTTVFSDMLKRKYTVTIEEVPK